MQFCRFALRCGSARRYGNAPWQSGRCPGAASRRSRTLYVGVTSDLFQRIPQHKQGLIEGFAK
jgi:hypothetical protein